MIWVEGSAVGYRLLLTDGYLSARSAIARGARKRSVPLEQAVAEHLYSAGKLEHWPAARREQMIKEGYAFPDPLHVWVVGSPGWIARSRSALLREIAGENLGPSYRIAIIGAGGAAARTPAGGRVAADWRRRLETAGMRAPPAADLPAYVTAASALLALMTAYRERVGTLPTSVLVNEGASVTFCGDDYPGSVTRRSGPDSADRGGRDER